MKIYSRIYYYSNRRFKGKEFGEDLQDELSKTENFLPSYFDENKIFPAILIGIWTESLWKKEN